MAAPSEDSTEVALALAEAIRKGGTYLASEPQRVRAILSDLLGPRARAHRAEVDAVVLAAQDGAPDQLLTDPSSGAALVARLNNLGLDDTMATFAIASWQHALGQLPTAPVGPLVITDSMPDPATTQIVVPQQPPQPTGPIGTGVPPPSSDVSEGTNRPRRIIVALLALAAVGLLLAGTVVAMIGSDGDETATDDDGWTTTTMETTRSTLRPTTTTTTTPTPDDIANADVQGEWYVHTDNLIACTGFESCEPDSHSPGFLYYRISCEAACTLTVESYDSVEQTSPTLTALGLGRNGSEYLATGDYQAGVTCQGLPDGPVQMEILLIPTAAELRSEVWGATQFSGVVTQKHPETGCNESFLQWDIGAEYFGT